MKPFERFAAALALATILYGGQLRSWTDARNRYLDHWARSDSVALIAGIVLLAVAGFAAHAILARRPLPRRIAGHLFIALFGAGLCSIFFSYPDYKSEMALLALAALVLCSWFRPAWRVPRRVAQAALVVSPIAVLMAWQFLRFPAWASPNEPPVRKIPAREAAPVFLFIFDEWSHWRSTEKGELLPLFKNVRAFAAQATAFDEARSPGPRTDESIPRMLWSREDDLVFGAGDTFWRSPSGSVPTAAAPNLFSLARERGYNSALLGVYLPYRRMLGAECDQVVSYLEHPKSLTFAGKLHDGLLRNIAFQHDPFSRRIARSLQQKILPGSRDAYSRNWEQINHRLQRDCQQLIAGCPPNQLGVFHIPIPHCPWVFNADGTYAGAYRGERMSHDTEGYRKHLAYLDLVIGQFRDALQRAGKYDNALVILTSDHSWRLDYTYDGHLRDGEEVRHVPLFVKLPGQTAPVRVPERYELLNLRAVIDATMRGDSAAAEAALHAK